MSGKEGCDVWQVRFSHYISFLAMQTQFDREISDALCGAPTRPTSELSLAQRENYRASHMRPGKVTPELCQEMLSMGEFVLGTW